MSGWAFLKAVLRQRPLIAEYFEKKCHTHVNKLERGYVLMGGTAMVEFVLLRISEVDMKQKIPIPVPKHRGINEEEALIESENLQKEDLVRDVVLEKIETTTAKIQFL